MSSKITITFLTDVGIVFRQIREKHTHTIMAVLQVRHTFVSVNVMLDSRVIRLHQCQHLLLNESYLDVSVLHHQ